MKKNFICGFLLVVLFNLPGLTSKAYNDSNNMIDFSGYMAFNQEPRDNDMPNDARPITVYQIVGTNAVVPKNAHYSSSKNRIYIKEGKHLMNYNIEENRQFGQESAMAKYKYRASNYFFDL